MVTAERGNNGGLVCQGDAVLVSGRVETLEDSGSTVKDSSALTADLDTDVNLIEVNEVGRDASDMGRRVGVEVGITQERAELVGLNLTMKEMSDPESTRL